MHFTQVWLVIKPEFSARNKPVCIHLHLLIDVHWVDVVIIGRILPESSGVRRPSGPEFTAEELDDLNIALQLPELSDVIPKDELRRLKKDEKKRQELINGNIIVVC